MSDSKMQAGDFCWHELMTPNVEQAKKFYSHLFGWKAEDQDMGGFIYTIFKQGEKGVAGMLQTPPDKKDVPPHWMNYVCVDDIDATIEKAKALGATIVEDKTKAGDYGYLAIIRDPTGAYFAIWKEIPLK